MSVPRSSGQSDLLTIVMRRKLQWYGHVSRSSGLAKTILQGTVKGGRRQGGQRKRWEDNIREWTGLVFAKSQRAMENREKWRKLVAKSSLVPQRPSRLKDRWGNERWEYLPACQVELPKAIRLQGFVVVSLVWWALLAPVVDSTQSLYASFCFILQREKFQRKSNL